MFTFQSKQSFPSKRSGRPSSSRTILQPKLRVHPAKDRYEQEADRAADQVLRESEPSSLAPKVGGAALGVQRECHCGGTCAACQASHQHQPTQLSPAAPDSAGVHAPPGVDKVLNSPGRPLDARTRSMMEPRFGFDFSRVRVHSGEEAERSEREVNALAYTVGPNIVFAKGQYQPAERSGSRLLAHELAHVVQQSRSPALLQRQQPPGPKPDNPPKKKDDAPACTFSIHYVKDKDIACDTLFEQQKGRKPPGKLCGRAVQYNVESVSAVGTKCPPLKGLKFTETKEIDQGKASCLPDRTTLAPSGGCVIGDNGKLTGCTDLYSLCGPLADINARTNGGCENTYTQKLFVDGKQAETHKIHFDIDTTASTCDTKMTRDGTAIP